MISENLKTVRQRVAEACARVGRDVHEVTLIAVSKTKPIEMLHEAIEEGVMDFGENKVQEILVKKPQVQEDIRFHMIGHLQTNKVKQVIGQLALIHSVDSMRLLETIQKEAEKMDLIVPILIQVNVAEEDSKFGIPLENTEAFVRTASTFPNVKVKGLMTIAPFVENAEENRQVFSKLYKEFLDIKSKNIDNVDINVLSMGMTGDYQVAIEEGATMVRVGTGIFGERNYNI